MSYKRACMPTEREVYFTKILGSLVKNNECHGTPMSSKNLQEAVRRVMAGTEEEEKMNVTSITLLWILCFSHPSQSIHKGKIKTLQIRDELLRTFMQKH